MAIGIEKMKDSKNSAQISSPTAKQRNSDIVTGNDDDDGNDGTDGSDGDDGGTCNGKSRIKEQESSTNSRMSPRNDEESQELLPSQSKDE